MLPIDKPEDQQWDLTRTVHEHGATLQTSTHEVGRPKLLYATPPPNLNGSHQCV